MCLRLDPLKIIRNIPPHLCHDGLAASKYTKARDYMERVFDDNVQFLMREQHIIQHLLSILLIRRVTRGGYNYFSGLEASTGTMEVLLHEVEIPSGDINTLCKRASKVKVIKVNL